MENHKEYRNFLKANFVDLNCISTDQMKGLEIPPIQKENTNDLISLPQVDKNMVKNSNIFDCMKNRRSRRSYKNKSISLHDLSFLLWATQGVHRLLQDKKITIRTVPSGGARHPFETYMAINNVEGIQQGIYRYQPLQHGIVFLFHLDNMKEELIKATLDQDFVGQSAVTFIWSVIPYRTEWRYSVASAKIILQDSGHLCQNLYLASEALGLGTCAIGAYDQEKMDALLGFSNEDEFTIYVAPVGVV